MQNKSSKLKDMQNNVSDHYSSAIIIVRINVTFFGIPKKMQTWPFQSHEILFFVVEKSKCLGLCIRISLYGKKIISIDEISTELCL